jgi:hypothetical protein
LPPRSPMMNVERRKTTRTKVEALAYINFEPNNGGIVLNVSEEGLCFHAVAPVQRSGTLHFWFSAEGQRVEATGELAWTDETRKAGGLRFAVLPAVVREQIRGWMDQCTMAPAPEQSPERHSTPTLQTFPFRELPFSASEAETNAGPELEPEVAHALAKPAPESHPPPGREAGRKDLQTRSVRNINPRNITPAWRPPVNYVRGVATGLSISALMAVAFSFHSYRRQFGESLISLGERFGARPGTQMASGAQAAIPGTLPEKTPSAGAAKPDQLQRVNPGLDGLHEGISSTFPITPSQLATRALDSSPVSGELSKTEQPEPAASTASLNANSGANLAANPAGADAPATEIEATSNLTGTGIVDEGRTPDFNSRPGKYLEVAAFRRKVSADTATNAVNALGIHAMVIHQSAFWNSYHVLVGPYSNQNEAGVARSALESHGFKARVLPSRSRRFRLPLMTLYGTDASVADCTITWDLYSPDATVTFTKGGTVVATAQGKWVKQNVTFKTNAVLNRSNDRGLKTLLEIQCHGMDQALVFGEAEAVRYFTPPPDVGL